MKRHFLVLFATLLAFAYASASAQAMGDGCTIWAQITVEKDGVKTCMSEEVYRQEYQQASVSAYMYVEGQTQYVGYGNLIDGVIEPGTIAENPFYGLKFDLDPSEMYEGRQIILVLSYYPWNMEESLLSASGEFYFGDDAVTLNGQVIALTYHAGMTYGSPEEPVMLNFVPTQSITLKPATVGDELTFTDETLDYVPANATRPWLWGQSGLSVNVPWGYEFLFEQQWGSEGVTVLAKMATPAGGFDFNTGQDPAGGRGGHAIHATVNDPANATYYLSLMAEGQTVEESVLDQYVGGITVKVYCDGAPVDKQQPVALMKVEERRMTDPTIAPESVPHYFFPVTVPAAFAGKDIDFVVNFNGAWGGETPFPTDGLYHITDVRWGTKTMTQMPVQGGAVYGSIEDPVMLNYVAATSMTPPSSISMTVGERRAIGEMFDYVPANASRPWSFMDRMVSRSMNVGAYYDFVQTDWGPSGEEMLHAGTYATPAAGITINWEEREMGSVEENITPIQLIINDPDNATYYLTVYADGNKVDDMEWAQASHQLIVADDEQQAMMVAPVNISRLMKGDPTGAAAAETSVFFVAQVVKRYDGKTPYFVVHFDNQRSMDGQLPGFGTYTIEPKDVPVTQMTVEAGRVFGSPDEPVVLNYVALTDVQVPEYYFMTLGETLDLRDIMAVTPSNASLPFGELPQFYFRDGGETQEFFGWDDVEKHLLHALHTTVEPKDVNWSYNGFQWSGTIAVSVQDQPVPLEGFVLNQPEQTVWPGEELDLSYTFTPENANHFQIEPTYENAYFALLQTPTGAPGLAVKESTPAGRYTITMEAYADGEKMNISATLTVIVKEYIPLQGITFNKPAQSVYAGEAVDVSYVLVPENANRCSVELEFDEMVFEWLQTNDGSTMLRVLDATQPGEYQIDAIAYDDQGEDLDINGSLTVTVKEKVRVERITVKSPLQMTVGSTVELTPYITVVPDNAYDKTYAIFVSDSSIVSVNEVNGVWSAKGKSVGQTSLYVLSKSNPEANAEIAVTVEDLPVPLVGLAFDKPEQAVFPGEEVDVHWTATPADFNDSNVRLVYDRAIFAPMQSQAGSLAGGGLRVREDAPAGTYTITAQAYAKNGQDLDIKATLTVTVKARVAAIRLSKESITVSKGSVTTLDDLVKVFPEDADQQVTWAVGDTATVVTVIHNNNGTWEMKANRAGQTALQVTSVENPQIMAFLQVTVESRVTGIQVVGDEQVLYVNGTEEEQYLQLEPLYTVQPKDAADKTVRWESSDTKVVSIVPRSLDGVAGGYMAKAEGVGEATLTVTTTDGGFSGNIYIKVRAHVEAIELNEYEITLQRGVPFDLTPLISVQPDDAFNKDVVWSCDDEAITFRGNTVIAGAGAQGEYILNVASVENPDISNELTATVEAAASAIIVEEPIQTVWTGETVNLGYYFEPADATSGIKGWKSSDESVVAITSTPNGWSAEAVKAGTATLTVTTDNDKTATITVTVKQHVTAIRLNEQSITLHLGATDDLSKYVEAVIPEDAFDKTVTWSSADAKVVSVAGTTATAVGTGTTTLIVTSNDDKNVQARLAVTVDALISGITVTNPSQTVWVGEKVDLSYTLTPPDASNKNVSWKTSNREVVQVTHNTTNNSWTATAKKAGTATLTVTTEEGGKTATITVTVKQHVTGIRLTEQSITLHRGNTADLSQYIEAILPPEASDKTVTWSSADAKVVSVSGATATAVEVGSTTLIVTSNDDKNIQARLAVTVDALISGITVTNPSQTVWVGENIDLSYTITPENASNTNVSWTSSDPGVVKIISTPNGWSAEAVKAGKATLTVKTEEGEKTATITVTVKQHVTSIELTDQSITMHKGETADLTKYIKAVLPDEASDKSVTWSSADAKTVSVSGTIATAVEVGSATLIVTSNDDKNVQARLVVTVDALISGITVNNPSQTVWVGESVDLGFNITPENASNKNVTWKTSDREVVQLTHNTTNNSWTATAKKAGTATLTVTTEEGGKTATIIVTVKQHVTGIRLTEQSITLHRGNTADLSQYIEAVLPEDASDKTVTWSSADAKVVSVSGATATAVAIGSTTLIVTSNDDKNIQARLAVTVDALISGITVTNPSQTVWVGENIDLSYTLTPPDASNKNVSWKTSARDIVEVTQTATNNSWTATAKKAGTATLTVTTEDGEKTATITVTVKQHVTGIQLTAQSITLHKGSTADLSKYIEAVQPEDASDKSVTWSSADTKVVSVSGTTATAVATGSTTLIVTSNDDKNVQARLAVTVDALISGITVTNPSQTVWVGENIDLSYTLTPPDASNKNVSWESSARDIVEVTRNNANGSWTATAKKAGTAKLTVTTEDGGKTATIAVTVQQHVTGLTLKESSITVQRGNAINLKDYIKEVLPADATNKDVTWTSNNANVTVNGSTATAKAIGESVLTAASVDNPKVTAKMTVIVEAAASGIYAEEPVQTVWTGENVNLGYYFEPKDATSGIKGWTSSDESIVKITSTPNGWSAEAVKAGKAMLTVTSDNGQTATITVTVKQHVTAIELTDQSITMHKGSTDDLTKYIKAVLPDDASDPSVTWSSENAKVVSVSGTIATAVEVGSATLIVTSNDDKNVQARLTVTVDALIGGITVSNPNQTVWVGEELDLGYTITPENASNKNVTWTSSARDIVEVTHNATNNSWTATAKKAGTATLTVTTEDGGKTAIITVTVKQHVTGIQLTKQSITLHKGSTEELSQYVKAVLPEDASDKAVTWSSENPKVVSVSGSTATALATGSTTLIATSNDDKNVQARLAVTVDALISGITVANPNQTVWVGESVDLSYTITPEDASNTNVSWTSSDPGVVEVTRSATNNRWTATAKKAGKATLTVKTEEGEKTAAITVTVKQHVTGIQLTKQSITLHKGSTDDLSQYVKAVLPEDASDKSVTWSSADTKVVSVSGTTATAVATGSTTLIVTSNDDKNVQARLAVTVDALISGITVSNPSQTVWVGEEIDLGYTIMPSDASNKNVSWTTSARDIVEVTNNNADGSWTATAKKAGTATLTVTTEDGGKTATITVTVQQHVTGLTLKESSITVQRGNAINLKEYIKEVLPADATNKDVTWTSNNANVVVNGDIATAKTIGESVLTAASVDNPEVTATMTVIVEASASGIYAEEPVQTVWTGENVNLGYYFEPKDATSGIKGWTSSDESVVKITSTPNGWNATAVKAGTATLTVTTDNGQTAKISVTVKQHVTAIQLNAQHITIHKGETANMTKYIDAILPTDASDQSVTWSSENPKVVSISGTIATAVEVGTATLVVTSNDDKNVQARLEVTVDALVSGITVANPSQTVWNGETVDLTFTITPAEASNKNVTWTTSARDIVEVTRNDADGSWTATAKKAGTATLTVTTEEGGKTATITVTVQQHVTGLTLKESTVTMQRGNAINLKDYIKEVLPADATNKDITWTSNNANVVVNGDIATAKAIGESVLTAASVDNPEVTATMTVIVEAAANGIYAEEPVQTVWTGENVNLGYYFEPKDATSGIKGWTSSNEAVVKITSTPNGWIAKAVKAGTATLTVTADNGQTATISVTVKQHVTAIELTTDAVSVNKGDVFDLARYINKVLPDDASDKTVTWSSNDPSIVSVAGTKATAVAIGTATLVVTSNDNKTVSARLTVTVGSSAEGIYVVNAEQNICIGSTVDLSVRFEPEDATSDIRSWTSSDPDIVFIDGDGIAAPFTATAVDAGTATLTVTTDNGQTATLTVTVYPALVGIIMTLEETTLETGDVLDLSELVTLNPEGALYDLTFQYIIPAGATDCLAVDDQGHLTAVASTAGQSYEVQILATDGFGNTAEAVLRVSVTSSAAGVKVANPNQRVRRDEEIDLSFTLVPESADIPEYSWSSSDESVVRVEYMGDGWRAYAMGVGQATLTLTVGAFIATIEVEVYCLPEFIMLSTQGERLGVGESICLDDFIQGFWPEDATETEVIWKSEDTSIVSISVKDGKYYATGESAGHTSLSVHLAADPAVASFMSVEVQASVVSITARNPEQTIYPDQYVDLSVDILPEECADRWVEWTCNEPDVLMMTYDAYTGIMQAEIQKYGTFTLTGTPDEGAHTCTITVHVVRHSDEIIFAADSVILDRGNSIILDDLITVLPDDAYSKAVTWVSENPDVISVRHTEKGWEATGVEKGYTRLTVTSDDNPSATMSIPAATIVKVRGIEVVNPEQVLYYNVWGSRNADLSVIFTPADADDQRVIWTSSDSTVVDLGDFGLGFEAVTCRQAGHAVLTVTSVDGGYSDNINVEVRAGVEQIRLTSDMAVVELGEVVDMNKFILEVLPEDAYDKSVVWTSPKPSAISIAEDGHTATVHAKDSLYMTVASVANPEVMARFYVKVGVKVTGIKVDLDELVLDVNEVAALPYTITPADADNQNVTWISTDESIVHVGHDAYMTHFTPEFNARGERPGTAKLVVITEDGGYRDTITVTVRVPKTRSISADPFELQVLKGETISGVITASPEYAVVDANQLTATFDQAPEGWVPGDITLRQNEDGTVTFEVTAKAWGEYAIQFDYPGTKGNGAFLQCGQRVDLAKGWNWISLARSTSMINGIDAIGLAFDGKLKDARTQSELLYDDPELGLFGTLDRLIPTCYKIEVTDEVSLRNPAVYYEVLENCSTAIMPGWTWLPYPYDTSYTLAELESALAATATAGDRIVSKADGFVEFDGAKWSGTLERFQPSEGYMYLNKSELHNLNWPAAPSLGQRFDDKTPAGSRRTLAESADVWSFDHRRFADNMTVVARVDGLTFPDDCTIGAFVGDECRGMGRYVDGRFFITIHGEKNEAVRFVIYDEATATYYDVPGSLGFTPSVGTLGNPVPLRVGEKTTDIQLLHHEHHSSDAVYDLGGRRVAEPVDGTFIIDGEKRMVK